METLNRRKLMDVFSHYVPPVYARKISENPHLYSLDGETKNLTMLFADIRNFTTISEGLSAKELKKLLNRFLTPMTQTIFDNFGTIDKYIGDMIMAFWGAPVDDKLHQQHALNAAIRMQAEVKKLHKEFARLNLPIINIGIGVNSGEVNVGDMGSQIRRAYTVIGDPVNVASRLESLTKYYGVNILVGEQTYIDQPNFIFRRVDRIAVKGKHLPTNIYELICYKVDASDELLEELALHEEALNFYYSLDWNNALKIFIQLKSQYSSSIIYKIFTERCEELIANPPSGAWSGVYEMKIK